MLSQTTGTEAIVAALTALPAALRRRALVAALRAGAVPVQQRAIQNFKALVGPKATGLAEKSVSIYSITPRNGRLQVAVAITRGAVSARRPVRGWKKQWNRVGAYASVFEFGKEHQPPRPWLRPAAQQSAQAAIEALTAYARAHLNDAVDEAKQK